MHLHLTLVLGTFLATTLHSSVAKVTTLPGDKGSTGSTKRIPCTFSENESFQSWRLPNGNHVTSTDTNLRPHVERESSTKYFLVISNIKSTDGGAYTCIGSKGNTAKFVLKVQFKIDKNSIKDQSLQLKKDGVIKLEASGYPKPEFEWTKDDKPITASGRYKIQDDGSLKISKVEMNDAGKYKCKVSQFQGLDIDTAEVNVKVFDPAVFTLKPKPELRPSQGLNVTMKCVAKGYPKPTYVWKNPGGIVIPTFRRFHVTNGELTILGVLPSDEGKYTCEATSEGGNPVKATSNIVKVYVAPTIVLSKQTLEIDEKDLGKSQTIECRASAGTSPVRVLWKRDNVKEERQKMSDNKSVLTLKYVRLTDVGTYTCEAQNDALDADGNPIVVKKSAFLRVRSKPKINEKASSIIVHSFVGNKKPVDIRCSFYGFPSPDVKIFNTKNKKVANGTKLAIYKLITKKADMFNSYRCYAENIYGAVNHTVKLDFAKPPTKIMGLTYTDVTCNAATIKWQEPSSDGGMPVVQYVIQYLTSTTNVDASTPQYKAIELKPDTDYTFTVWPRNRASRGPKEEITVKTKEFCKPSRPVILEPLSEILEDTTFTLKWRRPEQDGGDPNISYKVRYAPSVTKDESVEKKELKTSSLEMTLSDLKLGVKYSVEVVAINEGGESEPATRLYQVPRVSARSRSHAACASILFTVLAFGFSLVMK